MKTTPMTTLLGLFLLLSPCVASVNTDKAAVNAEGKRTITQVVKLLEDMLAKSKTEGDTERELFGKYKCYCDTNTQTETATVEEQTELIAVLESKIEQLQSSTGLLSEQVAQLDADMASNVASRASAKSLRDKRNADFVTLRADLTKAIGQMKQAIKTLADIGADQTTAGAAADQKFMMAGFDRDTTKLLSVKRQMKQALIAASTLLNGKVEEKHTKIIESFIQAPFTGTYSAQSGEVVGILKDMRDTFKANKQAAIAQEKSELDAHEKLTKVLEAAHKEMKESHIAKQSKLGGNDGDLSTKKTQLTEAEQAKADAEQFLAELTEMCTKKADEYKQRVMLRTNEDAAIAEAISILNSDAAFATFGTVSATSTGSTGAVFLQSKSVRAHSQVEEVRKAVAGFLAPKAASSSRVARVASLLQGKNPFHVVLAEIEKMIDIIAREGTEDKEQQQWCDDERTKHNGIVTIKTTEINALQGDIDELDDTINNPIEGLKKQIATDEESLETNEVDQKTETAQRTKENLMYQSDVANLVEAETLLARAIKALTTYYDTIALVQNGKKYTPPAPPASWEGGENQAEGSFQGQQGSGMQAINMIAFILDETKKEETQAHDFEREAQHSFEDSMGELTTTESELRTNLAKLQKELTETEIALAGKIELHKVTVAEKEASEAYLAKIKRGCDWIDTNLQNRKDSRKSEKEALEKAAVTIKATPAFKSAVEEKRQVDLGECKDICNADGVEQATCKACLAKTSVPGYCAGHPGTAGC